MRRALQWIVALAGWTSLIAILVPLFALVAVQAERASGMGTGVIKVETYRGTELLRELALTREGFDVQPWVLAWILLIAVAPTAWHRWRCRRHSSTYRVRRQTVGTEQHYRRAGAQVVVRVASAETRALSAYCERLLWALILALPIVYALGTTPVFRVSSYWGGCTWPDLDVRLLLSYEVALAVALLCHVPTSRRVVARAMWGTRLAMVHK